MTWSDRLPDKYKTVLDGKDLDKFNTSDKQTLNNIDINLVLAKSSPVGVDTNEDYEKVKKVLET